MTIDDTVLEPTETEEITAPPATRGGPRRDYPGALIVVEGIDGSGKSTQLYLLKRWLASSSSTSFSD